MENELIALAAGFLGARGTKFLDEVLKPTGALVGKDLAKVYAGFRGQNLAKVVDGAEAMTSGQVRMPIPGRIIFPLVEHASIEDDDDMQTRWSALLANASSTGEPSKILPAYVEILRQLTPVHARMVDLMYDNAFNMGRGPDDLLWYDQKRPEIQKALTLSHESFALFMADLDRMKLITTWRPPVWAGDDEDKTTQYNVVQITALTIGFVRACRRPSTPNPLP